MNKKFSYYSKINCYLLIYKMNLNILPSLPSNPETFAPIYDPNINYELYIQRKRQNYVNFVEELNNLGISNINEIFEIYRYLDDSLLNYAHDLFYKGRR